MAFKIPHMYWSTSSPSNNAVLLRRDERERSVNAERETPTWITAKTTGRINTVYVFKLEKLTCIQDIAMSPARSSVVSMIPNQNTARTRKTSPLLFGTLFQNSASIMASDFRPSVRLFFPEVVTWTCLQSWPLAGSCIRRKVIGHLRETLMAVCSTPSSPLSVALPDDAATLLKFLLTLMQKERYVVRKQGLWQWSGH